MTEHEVAEQVAIAMRKRWGELDPDTQNLIPWADSDKRDVWIEIAKAGIDTYKQLQPGEWPLTRKTKK